MNPLERVEWAFRRPSFFDHVFYQTVGEKKDGNRKQSDTLEARRIRNGHARLYIPAAPLSASERSR
jgi:hypothetical protein